MRWFWKIYRPTFDRSFKRFSDCHHDIGAEHPEDVIEEKSTKKYAASNNIVQMEEFNSIHSKCKAKEIIGNPMLQEESWESFQLKP